jgi:SOS-response transcriptional repressor LexA
MDKEPIGSRYDSVFRPSNFRVALDLNIPRYSCWKRVMSETVYSVAFFPKTFIYEFVTWRVKLRAAIDRSGLKHSVVALDAGITPETLSRILTSGHQRPSLDTITRIAHAVNENVGWILDERGFALSARETKQLREVVSFLDTTLLKTPTPRTVVRAEPNVLRLPARRRSIPTTFVKAGARVTYQTTDDSLRDAGILDGDLLYVKPLKDLREAEGRLIVCDLTGEPFAKVLEMKGGRMWLLSRNERYAPREVYEVEIDLIGAVVGRMGAVTGEIRRPAPPASLFSDS